MAEATLDTATPVVRDENAVDLGCTVSVESFSGPLDLLLFLVRKSELDIIDIPIATIADQFVMLVASWQQEGQLDLEMAGDFILMAATLLEIKARTIAPPPITEGEQVDTEADDLLDPRADLIGKLLAYRRFKEAVGLLMQAESARSLSVLRQTREDIPEDPDEAAGIDLGELQVSELSKYWYTLLARIGGAGPRTVMKDDLPIEGSIRKLSERAEAEQQLTLQQVFASEPTLQGRVSMLMATLECTRQRIVRTSQLEQYGEIAMQFRPEADRIIVPVQFPPDEAGKKRRRRPPLVTFTAPVAPSADEQEDVPEVEEKHETDEERFLRELNEACDLDGVLARVQDVEKGFQQYWEVLHPAPPPAPVPETPVQVAAPVLEVVAPADPPAAVQAEVHPLAVVAGMSDVPVAAETSLVAEQQLGVHSLDQPRSAPVAEEPVLALAGAHEAQAPAIGIAEVSSPGGESTASREIAQAVVHEVRAAAQPEPALAAEPPAELDPAPDAASMAAVAVVPESAPGPIAADTVSLVSSMVPLVTVAVEETQAIEVVEPIVEASARDNEAIPLQGLASEIGTCVDAPPMSAPMEESVAVAEGEVDIVVPPRSSEPEAMGETALTDLPAPERESIGIPTVADSDPEPVHESAVAADSSEPAESDSSPVPATAATGDLAAANEAEMHADGAPPALIDDAPQAIAPQPATLPTSTMEPLAAVVAAPVEELAPVSVNAVSAETGTAEPLHLAHVSAQAQVMVPVAEAPVQVAEMTAPVMEPPTPGAVAPAPVVASGPSSPAPAGLRSRTLLLLLAGTAGAACAVWWSMRTASVVPEPTVTAAAPVPVVALARETSVDAPVAAPIAAADPVIAAGSPAQPASAPASQAGLRSIQTAPSPALIERFTGAAEQWLDRQSLPIAVPWYACTEMPVLPAGPASFTSEPRFAGLPVLAWARPEAWAWCLQVRTIQPPEPFLPASAFIPALAVPDSLALWAQPGSLAGVPVATFAEDLGWTVLVRPAPAPRLDIWLGRR